MAYKQKQIVNIYSVKWSAMYSPLYCMDVTVGLLFREWNRSWKLQKCGFYGICWSLLLTDKSKLWDTSWERVSWKISRWPGWSKAKELEIDKGKRLWTGCHLLVRNNVRWMTYWKSIKIVMNIYWSPTSEFDTALALLLLLLSASLYVSKRGAYWDRLCRDVVGRLSRACTVAKRCILGL